MPSSEPRTITVIGAGVIGLTIALLLSNDTRNKVLVVAEFMPDDDDVTYASAWAGANFLPMSQPGTVHAQLEKDTYKVLKQLALKEPKACIHIQDAVVYTREEDVGNTRAFGPMFVNPGEEPWWKDVVDNYRLLPKEALPQGIAAGSKFTSLCINIAPYLRYLESECRRKGVSFRRQRVQSLAEAQAIPHQNGNTAQIVVNATGLGSRTLLGVEDATVRPARGQTALVQNDPGYMMVVSGGKAGTGLGYCMTRAGGGGTVLGGSYELDNTSSAPDLKLASQFMKNVVDFCPEIVKPGESAEAIKLVKHRVGLRPTRRDGPRIEMETLYHENGTKPWTVVHCYGHGGFGYQTSWASAEKVLGLVKSRESRL